MKDSETLEESKQISGDKYHAIMEDMRESYYEVDLKGNLIFFNDALCRQLGYSREELMGMNYTAYTKPEEVKRYIEIYKEVYETGNSN